MTGSSRCKRLAGVVVALASALSLSLAAAADTTPGGLGAKQIAQLRSQPLPIVAPGYIPPGFRLVHIEAIKRTPYGSANRYSLQYRSADGRQFSIDVADGEFGDAEPDTTSFRRPFVVNSSLIGSTTISPYKIGTQGQEYWVYASDYRSLERLGNPHAILTLNSRNMSPDELRRIYSSLRSISR